MAERFCRLGCDIGGTFTDFVLLDDRTGELHVYKCLTTPRDPSDAVEQGVRVLADRLPGMVEGLDEVIHGTTLVINAIIERKGAVTGLITTKGFRDVLELGREIRYAPYDVFAEFPKPLVPRRLRLEVDERVRSDGTVIKALDPAEARAVVERLVGMGVESIAVCLLNSFENPAHERMPKEIIGEVAPHASLSISYDVLPQLRDSQRPSPPPPATRRPRRPSATSASFRRSATRPSPEAKPRQGSRSHPLGDPGKPARSLWPALLRVGPARRQAARVRARVARIRVSRTSPRPSPKQWPPRRTRTRPGRSCRWAPQGSCASPSTWTKRGTSSAVWSPSATKRRPTSCAWWTAPWCFSARDASR